MYYYAARFASDRGLAVWLGAALLVLAGCSDLATAPEIAPEISGEVNATAAPFAGARFFVDPNSDAQRTVEAWRKTRPQDAEQMEEIASQPQAIWFGDWNPQPYDWVSQVTARITAQGALPVYVLYNIPQRDCGSYSAGGAGSAGAYQRWVGEVARAIGDRSAVVILEPDAVAGLDCLSAGDQQARYGMLQEAIRILKQKPGISVYLDAGNARWHSPEVIAERLRHAGIAQADGFALNVSNFIATEESARYGAAVSQRVGDKHFVIDTSRNGRGAAADGEWCNPEGRALGQRPSTDTGRALVDAYLWIKTPGESDGTCNGGPRAGEWWPEYALGLARRAS